MKNTLRGRIASSSRLPLAGLLARGYVESATARGRTEYRAPAGWQPLKPGDETAIPPAEVIVILPTTLSRLDDDQFAHSIEQLLARLRETQRAHQLSAGLVVLTQVGSSEEFEIARRRRYLVGDAPDVSATFIVSQGSGKLPALNLVLDLLPSATRYVGWVDDDVDIEPMGVTHLTARLAELDAPAAVGARKVPHVSGHATSEAMSKAKGLMPSAMNYPHGCAMMVTRDVVASGIPTRYASDDGWVCFQLLRPDRPDPFESLKIEDSAAVHYTVAGDFWSTVRRLRRQRIGQLLLMADAPADIAWCYVRHCFLVGTALLPRFRTEPPRTAVRRSTYSWVHLGSTTALAIELMVRGLIGKPLRKVEWGSPLAVGRTGHTEGMAGA